MAPRRAIWFGVQRWRAGEGLGMPRRRRRLRTERAVRRVFFATSASGMAPRNLSSSGVQGRNPGLQKGMPSFWRLARTLLTGRPVELGHFAVRIPAEHGELAVFPEAVAGAPEGDAKPASPLSHRGAGTVEQDGHVLVWPGAEKLVVLRSPFSDQADVFDMSPGGNGRGGAFATAAILCERAARRQPKMSLVFIANVGVSEALAASSDKVTPLRGLTDLLGAVCYKYGAPPELGGGGGLGGDQTVLGIPADAALACKVSTEINRRAKNAKDVRWAGRGRRGNVAQFRGLANEWQAGEEGAWGRQRRCSPSPLPLSHRTLAMSHIFLAGHRGHFREILEMAPVSSHPFCGTLPASDGRGDDYIGGVTQGGGPSCSERDGSGPGPAFASLRRGRLVCGTLSGFLGTEGAQRRPDHGWKRWQMADGKWQRVGRGTVVGGGGSVGRGRGWDD